MESDVRQRLEAAKSAIEAEIDRLKADHDRLVAVNEKDESADRRAEIRRRKSLLTEARERLKEAGAALRIFEKTGQEHAVVVEGTRAFGSIAVHVPPGTSHEARGRIIDDALSGPLEDAATELGVVLAAAPSRFVRERAGRDAEGRTVLDVHGRAEGDRLVPAVSTAAKSLRS